MTRHEEQAFNDGRAAWRNSFGLDSCKRRNPNLKQHFLRGYEHERRIDLGNSVTPEERAESDSALSDLKKRLSEL